MDTKEWIEVTEAAQLAEILGVDSSSINSNVYSVLTALASRDEYWKTRHERPALRPDELMHSQILKTRIFLNWTEAKRIRDDIVIVGVVFAATQNAPLSALLGAARKLKDTVSLLTEDETELVRVIMGIAAPSSAYAVGVPEVQVRDAYVEATVDIDKLLDSLQAKKILRPERVGKLRLII